MAESRRALVLGVGGQDGYYLAQHLIERGIAVYGVVRPKGLVDPALAGRLAAVLELDLVAPDIASSVRDVRPDHIYHLAAHHGSADQSEMMDEFDRLMSVNLLSVQRLLELVRTDLPRTRLFYAASSHVFGSPRRSPQDESTPHQPETLYGISKSAALRLCDYYRRRFKVFASAGILYNHESPRRGPAFVTSKLASAAATAAKGGDGTVRVQDLAAVVDWGSARDYVRAMRLILEQDAPDDFVVATGQAHTVAEFAAEAFRYVGLRSQEWVTSTADSTPAAAGLRIGDIARIRARCGWYPETTFEETVHEMVDGALARLA